MVDRSEYKRRQSPPGIKITPGAFGKNGRMPITNLYTSEGFNGKDYTAVDNITKRGNDAKT